MKFKIGDKVKVDNFEPQEDIKTPTGDMETARDRNLTLTVTQINNEDHNIVKLNDGYWYHENWLKLADDSPTLHEAALSILNLKIGDYVKVEFAVPNYFGGWICVWNKEMDKYVEKVFEVRGISDYGVRLNTFNFPAFCLTKVPSPNIEVKLNDKYTASVGENEVKVGCQTFSREAVKKLFEACQETGILDK